MSPTYGRTSHFSREYQRLSDEERALFAKAIKNFVADLRRGRFRKALRVKAYRSEPGVFEMTWAPNGRALFRYGKEIRKGEPHVVWLRIGGHDIL